MQGTRRNAHVCNPFDMFSSDKESHPVSSGLKIEEHNIQNVYLFFFCFFHERFCLKASHLDVFRERINICNFKEIDKDQLAQIIFFFL